jgi:hypothetical protein
MKIAAAELKEGNDNANDEAEMSSDESSDESDKDEWEEDEDGSEGRSKTKKFSSVDKVHRATVMLKDDADCHLLPISFTQLLWIFFGLKSNERRFDTSFESFASPRINTSFLFAAW